MSESKKLKKKSKKEKTPGIIYLSRVPPFMGVKHVRQYLSVHGETGKIFLQPDEREETAKRRLRCQFTEGWVEFLDKRVAKRVALALNGHMIGGKRRSRWYEEMWTMKYLPKFRWAHLNERLEYERMIRKQKLQTEISQAKKEVEFFRLNVERGQAQTRYHARMHKKAQLKDKFENEFDLPGGTVKKLVELKRKSSKVAAGDNVHGSSVLTSKGTSKDKSVTSKLLSERSKKTSGVSKDMSEASASTDKREFIDRDWTFKQKETEDQIQTKKRKRKSGNNEVTDGHTQSKKQCNVKAQTKAADNKTFLKNLFSGGIQ